MDEPGPNAPSGNRHAIPVPERSRAWPSALILLIAATLASFPVLIFREGLSLRVLVGPAVLLVVLFRMALATQDRMAVHLGLLALLLGLWDWAPVWPPYWPLRAFVPVAVYGLAVLIVPSLRQSLQWLRPGVWTRRVGVELLAVVLVSTAGLWGWYYLAKPSLALFALAVPSWHPVLVALLGLGFALVNAAVEEAIFRGVAMQSLEAALGRGAWSLVLQALPFGALHLLGVPGGPIGVAMAAAYGVMLGWLRRRSQGMLAPYLAHVLADVAVFGMVCAELAA
jgi:membrane protease YdiL (CAAX protease family)